MHVLVAGSSGFIGRGLVARLRAEGHRVIRLVRAGRSRTPDGADLRAWSPESGTLAPSTLEDVEAVVHLGGANIASLWTRGRRELIRNSRIDTTRLVAERLVESAGRCRVFVHASGANYYGDRGDEILVESSPPGTSFLADLCRDWEAASLPAERAGVRVVRVRTGLVLSAHGGFLPRIAGPFRLGIGARLGGGRQWMPWIAYEDIIGVYARALTDDSLRGAVNAVGPETVTNAEFTRALGRAVGRPTPFVVPGLAIRLLPGGIGRELLLASERVAPKALRDAGFAYESPTLEKTFRPFSR